jgi:hypothetical protein
MVETARAMRRRTKILVGAGVAVVLALIAWYLSPMPSVKADAIKVLGLIGDPKVEPGTNLWTLSVGVSNRTRKTLAVLYPALQAPSDYGWQNVSDVFENYVHIIGPYGSATQTFTYAIVPPVENWRWRLYVSERLTGVKKFTKARWMGMPLYNCLNPATTLWGPYREVVSPVFGSKTVAQDERPR